MNKWLAVLGLLVIISGCGKTTDSSVSKKESISENDAAIVEVEIETDPSQLLPGEEVTLRAVLSQQDVAVEDANEVKFEIWKKATDNRKVVMAQHKKAGKYEAQTVFPEAGVYYVVAHTTANDIHVMPKIEMIVGDAESSQTAQNTETNEGSEEGYHHHEGAELVIHLATNNEVFVGDEQEITAEIQQGTDKLREAAVRFEIWKNGNDLHHYISATEQVPGRYKAPYNFKEAGEYNITIHVEKGSLHAHQEESITVTTAAN